jgi:hypothetical protein
MKQAVNDQYGLMSPQQAAGLNGRSPRRARGPDRRPILEMLMASSDLSEVTFSQ